MLRVLDNQLGEEPTMFDNRVDMFVWIAFTVLFFVAVGGVIAVFGDSTLTGVLAVALLGGACWVYPKLAERFADK